jgi:HSP20 family protein
MPEHKQTETSGRMGSLPQGQPGPEGIESRQIPHRRREGGRPVLSPAMPVQALPPPPILSPFTLMRQMVEGAEQLFNSFWVPPLSMLGSPPRPQMLGVWSPKVDMLERDGQLVVQAELPGFRAGDIRVELAPEGLIITGEREVEYEEADSGIYRMERHHGRFHRIVPLPEELNLQEASATLQGGVLEVMIPLPERARRRRIDVRARGEAGQTGVSVQGAQTPRA